MFYNVGVLKKKTYRKTPVTEFFFLYHQACNFIKKRLRHRCFTRNFVKLLKALCRTPPVSGSNFNLKKRISPFSQHYFFLISLSHFMSFMEARNKSIWFYTKFWAKQAVFVVLTNILLVFCRAANQYSEITGFFSKILNQSEHSNG